MEYDVIVIGAGTAGLAAALKLSACGQKVLLLEKQPLPGGLATGFIRRGFTFESVLHCVNSLGEEGEVRDFLKEYNLDKEIGFIDLKDFARIIYPENDFIADFNRDNFSDFLKNNFPVERNNLERFFSACDKFYRQFDCFRDSKLPAWLNLILAPLFYPQLISISLLSTEELISKYIKDAKVKAIISSIWGFMGLPPEKLSAFYFLIVFRGYHEQSTAYVKGGFLQLFLKMAAKIRENGAEVKFNCCAQQIITKKGKSIQSVITDKGEEFKTKAIICNANAFTALTQLIDVSNLREEYQEKISKMEKSLSAFQVYLGLKVPAKALGMTHSILLINTTYNHEESYRASLEGNYDRCALIVTDHAQIDATLVPEKKGSLLITVLDNYDHWKDLAEEVYKSKKIEIANRLISRLETYLPGLSGNIEIMEVATPKTIARFGAVPEGAIYGFAQSVAQSGINRLSQNTKIKGLFLAGAWTIPGAGVHACFVSGNDAADLVLKFLKIRH